MTTLTPFKPVRTEHRDKDYYYSGSQAKARRELNARLETIAATLNICRIDLITQALNFSLNSMEE